MTGKKFDRGAVGTKVTEIATAADMVGPVAPRALDEMGELVYPGAKEIATLTLVARSHDWEFKPVMDALHELEKITDWSHPFMVAYDLTSDGLRGPQFTWRRAPYKRYESFNDFYKQELEATFGKWADLQARYAEVAAGTRTANDAKKQIEQERREADAQDQANQRPVGTNQYSEGVDNKNNVINTRPDGTSRAYALRRLRTAGKTSPEIKAIHARVLAGEITAHAGMIEAGFRKRIERKKLSAVDRELNRIASLTRPERRVIWLNLNKEFGK